MKSGETNMELKALHRHGWAVTDLAREFGLSRTTIYKELASDGPRGYAGRDRPTALNEAQVVHVERRLAVCSAIRGTDLHTELRQDYGYAGSYPAFQRQLRVMRPAQVRDPEIRFETDPGRQTQTDWALLGLYPVGEEMVELNALVSILGCSVSDQAIDPRHDHGIDPTLGRHLKPSPSPWGPAVTVGIHLHGVGVRGIGGRLVMFGEVLGRLSGPAFGGGLQRSLWGVV